MTTWTRWNSLRNKEDKYISCCQVHSSTLWSMPNHASDKRSRNVRQPYLLTCAPREDSDQTAQSRSLIWIFSGRILCRQKCNVSSWEQQRLIRMCGYASWFESSLGEHIRRYIFSRWDSNDPMLIVNKSKYQYVLNKLIRNKKAIGAFPTYCFKGKSFTYTCGHENVRTLMKSLSVNIFTSR